MKTYRCKHTVLAVKWTGLFDDLRPLSKWGEQRNIVIAFVDDQPNPSSNIKLMLPNDIVVDPGEWVIYSDNNFIVMSEEDFKAEYEAA